MNLGDVLKSARSLRGGGRTPEAQALLRDALRRGVLDAEEVEKAGRSLLKDMAANAGDVGRPTRVRLLGQCTVSWLVPSLTAVAWGQGASVLAEEGGYDQVFQDLQALPDGPEAPRVVVLMPWSNRLLEGTAEPGERVALEVDFWKQAWAMVAARPGLRLLQVGYDWVVPGPLGYCVGGQPTGAVDLVREVNAALRKELPRDAYFLDLEAVSGTTGRATFYDMRRYHWTKQPFSEAGTLLLAGHLWAGVRALTTGPKKVLVVDLDNTLWGGVVGETGPLGVALGESPEGEAFRAFQRHVRGLARRGVVIAIASKNNPADGREPFDVNPDMVLRPDDVAAWEVNWGPKGESLARIAETLSLGLDSFVFFDDNPAEREQVLQALPEVSVVDVPDEPAEFVRALQAGLWFEATGLTAEDGQRAEQYAVESKRRELRQAFASTEDYLRSLEMVADARPVDEADLPRVVQLLAKTNQFNLTTRRHSEEQVCELIGRPGAVHLTLRLRDRFGDHGLIAVLLAVPEPDWADALRVDTWLMSCRVLGRTVEQFLLRELARRAEAGGYRRLLGEYLPTKKNMLVARLYDDLGFRRVGGKPADTDATTYMLDLGAAEPPPTWVVDGAKTT